MGLCSLLLKSKKLQNTYVARRHHVVVMVIHFAALAFRPFASALASTFLVERLVQLKSRVILNVIVES